MKVWSFLGSEPSNGSGSLSLGLDVEGWDWMSLLIAMTNLRVSASSGFMVAAGVSLWFLLSMGLTCMDLGCMDGCVDLCLDDMGTGIGRCDSSSSWGCISRKVKDGVRFFESCCYSGVLSEALGHMMSRKSRCSNILLGVSALHYSTGSQEGFQTLASACVLCLTTFYSVSEYFKSVPEALRMSRSFVSSLGVWKSIQS